MQSLSNLGKTLARNASRLRRQNDLTVTQTAQLTGVSPSTLRRIEKARDARRTYKPMLSTVVKLARVSGVTVDEFIGGRLNW